MTCERWRDAISAGADGEQLGVDGRLLDAHLGRCPACRSFAATMSKAGVGGRGAPPRTCRGASPG